MASTHSFMAIKLTGFQKNNHKGDYTYITIHYIILVTKMFLVNLE